MTESAEDKAKVERVAKAIYSGGGGTEKMWQNAIERTKNDYRNEARAAIKAMEEPPYEMPTRSGIYRDKQGDHWYTDGEKWFLVKALHNQQFIGWSTAVAIGYAPFERVA